MEIERPNLDNTDPTVRAYAKANDGPDPAHHPQP